MSKSNMAVFKDRLSRLIVLPFACTRCIANPTKPKLIQLVQFKTISAEGNSRFPIYSHLLNYLMPWKMR